MCSLYMIKVVDAVRNKVASLTYHTAEVGMLETPLTEERAVEKALFERHT